MPQPTPRPTNTVGWLMYFNNIRAYETAWTATPPTRAEAERILRGALNHWMTETTGDEGEEVHQQVARSLAARIHGDIHWRDLADAIEARTNLRKVNWGTHPDLHRNNSGTVDNTTELRDYCDSEINVTVRNILDKAGIR